MDNCHEEWVPVCPDAIPSQKYSICASNSDADGLVIYLIGSEYEVKIEFGFIQAMQMLDEGTNLNDSPNHFVGDSVQQIRKQLFPNTIYEVHNSFFSRYIKNCMGSELYDALKLRQFNIITQNFVISIICRWEPVITVCCIKTRTEDGLL